MWDLNGQSGICLLLLRNEDILTENRFTEYSNMIIGVGVDIVKVVRIERAIERWADRFLVHVFTPAEIKYCRGHAREGIHFAARFAAKEAVKKAAGEKFMWTDVEIANVADGKPVVRLGEENLCANAGKWHIFLTMSHTDEYAIAYVVIENTEDRKI